MVSLPDISCYGPTQLTCPGILSLDKLQSLPVGATIERHHMEVDGRWGPTQRLITRSEAYQEKGGWWIKVAGSESGPTYRLSLHDMGAEPYTDGLWNQWNYLTLAPEPD